MILKTVHIVLMLVLFALPFAAKAASLAGNLMPGTSNYFENFDPEQRPWEPGQNLNYEEVFKNYEFYEIVPDHSGNEITVNHYIRGAKTASVKYLILPNGSLQKK